MTQAYNVIVSYDDAKAYFDRGPRGNLSNALDYISTKAGSVFAYLEPYRYEIWPLVATSLEINLALGRGYDTTEHEKILKISARVKNNDADSVVIDTAKGVINELEMTVNNLKHEAQCKGMREQRWRR